VVVRQRVVALLYGDRNGEALTLGELADLLATMPAVNSAFERIVQVRKLEAMRAQGSTASAEAAPQGTFSRPPPRDTRTARELPLIPPPARVPVAEPEPEPKFEGAPKSELVPDDPAERPTMQLSAEEIAAGMGKRPNSPAQLMALPRADVRKRREQEITRPARPSRLGSRPNAPVPGAPDTALTEPDLADPDEPVDPPSPRTLSHPPPGVGSYAVRGAQQDVVDFEQRAKAAQERIPNAEPAARGPARPDPRREGVKASKLPPEVVAIPEAVRVSIRSPRTAAAEPAPASASDPAAEARRLVEQLGGLGPDEDEPVIAALLQLGDPALEALERKFPGVLWFERQKLRTHVPAGRDVSAIARALFAFEGRALPHVATLLGASKPEVRLCALLVAKDWVDQALLGPLGDRVYDSDGTVRLLALETLPTFQKLPRFGELVKSLRSRAGSPNETVQNRLCAVEALSVLRDAGGLELLAELSGHENRQLSVPAHRALIAITAQDFGTTPRKWKAWIDRNRHKHRAEWLIDGLMHSEERVRATAAVELQKLTQVHYAFTASGSKRERERTQSRYRDWWESEGRTQFE
jgi:hypothetical protein